MMKVKIIIELLLAQLLSLLSPRIAKVFVFRKARNINFSSVHRKHGEVELLLLPYLLTKDSVFIDVGANRGLYCYYAEQSIPQRNIVAFEPVPKLASLLKKLFPRIEVVSKALSDHTGVAVLNIPRHQKNYQLDTRSTLEPSSPDLSGVFNTISVETTTLDAFVRTAEIKQIALIKIDVEGHELKVIAGGNEVLKRMRPFLIVEIEPRHYQGNLQTAFARIDALEYAIFFFDLQTLTLKVAYDPHTGMSEPQEVLQNVHNYLCIPQEKAEFAQTITMLVKRA